MYKYNKYNNLNYIAFDYDPVLPVCFEGLLETEHPYSFASRQCIRELLLADVIINLYDIMLHI